MMRISTQAYVLVDGHRKQLEFNGDDGVVRVVSVDIDLADCGICGALVAPTAAAGLQHAQWHRQSGEG